MPFNPRSLPKIELHVHLDTCLSYFYVRQHKPKMRLNDFNSMFVAPLKCHDLGDFLNKINPQIEILQTVSTIELAVDDLFDQLKDDNVIYVELRFAPLLHTEMGLSSEEVVETTIDAIKKASTLYGIEAGLLLCTLRHFSEMQSLETARLVNKYLNKGVVGLDLAADEARYPLKNHISAFQLVKDYGGNLIAHAGEACGADSVAETIERLNVSRVGHGVRSIEDYRVIEIIKNNNIHLEICPSCNLTCNVFDNIRDHPINKLKELGVKFSVNTDARTVANVTLNQEYKLLHDTFGWGKDEFYSCNKNSLDASFAPQYVKAKLLDRLNLEYIE